MKIQVAGMDPSFNHWGIAEGLLDLETGCLETPNLMVIEPMRLKGKQVRQNSKDLHETLQLGKQALEVGRRAKFVFVEIPVGSQSARSMASYGFCVGILGVMQAEGVNLVEVSATEVKLALTGKKNATKDQMVQAAFDLYPDANFPRHPDGEFLDRAEHVADAVGSIHAGVLTPLFRAFLQSL